MGTKLKWRQQVSCHVAIPCHVSQTVARVTSRIWHVAKKIQKKKFKKKIQKKIKKNYKNYKKLKNPKTDTWQGS